MAHDGKHKNTHEHGRHTARQRYGEVSGSLAAKPEDQPQDPIDKHGPGYDNDVPVNSWLRSDGQKKPGFDHGHKGK